MKLISIFILIIIKVTLCCDDPMQISILPPFHDKKSVQSKVGEDLNIICCHPDGADNLSWTDKLKNEIVFSKLDGVYSIKDEKNRLILRIDNVDDSKAGEYTCTNNKRKLSRSIIISAKTSIIPKIIKKTILYPNNRPIEIKCPIVKEQFFKKWIFTRNGKVMTNTKSSADGSYTISNDKLLLTINTNVTANSITYVSCLFQEVDYKGDVTSGIYEFSWQSYDPIDTKLIVDNKGPIQEGDKLVLKCTFRYSDELSIAFPYGRVLNNNMRINNDKLKNGEVILTINKITKESNGEYQCKITKFIDLMTMTIVEEMASVRIDVVMPLKIVTNQFAKSAARIGDNMPLVCQINSRQVTKDEVYFEHYQSQTSDWLKITENNEKYKIEFTVGETSDLTFLIKKISWDDRGKYRCVVKSLAGKDSQIGLLKVEKPAELLDNIVPIFLTANHIRINCTLSGYPLSASEDTLELQVLTQSSPPTVDLIDKRLDDIDGFVFTYDVKFQGELQGGSNKLQCLYKNSRTNIVRKKEVELKMADKPNIPIVRVACAGSSGIVFMYQILPSNDRSQQIVKHVLSYAPSKDFISMTRKPLIVIPIKDNENKGNYIYVLKDLVDLREYTIKWEAYNVYGLSNELILTSRTKGIMPPQSPERLIFSHKDNMISVNASWQDDCPYPGSNSDIRDIAVSLKLYQPLGDDDNNNMQWIERNFTLDISRKSVQFFITLANPQIDYKISISLRSAQGSSLPRTEIYRAENVLIGSSFYCFPRCAGSMLSWNLSVVQFTLSIVSLFVMTLRW